jgi:hypothetical protein
MVQHWISNSTLNAQACKNATGGPYKPSENGRWDIDSGGLYNGMVRPFINMTIKGALWVSVAAAASAARVCSARLLLLCTI